MDQQVNLGSVVEGGNLEKGINRPTIYTLPYEWRKKKGNKEETIKISFQNAKREETQNTRWKEEKKNINRKRCTT